MKHRHSQSEILWKLRQAEQMATEGKSQRDIASSLHVSVMTYHRWRKANRAVAANPPLPDGWNPQSSAPLPSKLSAGPISQQEITKLQTENLRLRRLVTDLLLEKVRLEEEVSADAHVALENGHAAAI
jgi:transposase